MQVVPGVVGCCWAGSGSVGIETGDLDLASARRPSHGEVAGDLVALLVGQRDVGVVLGMVHDDPDRTRRQRPAAGSRVNGPNFR